MVILEKQNMRSFMKFAAVFFDWGDTLSVVKKSKTLTVETNNWIAPMIHKLYQNSYRLAIISNTHRYQDAWWIRNELAKVDCLSCFELVVSSAMYGKHKPDLSIFQKALDFMELDPCKVLMIGDSEHCDGACQYLGMQYMLVKKGENWSTDLFKILGDENVKNRKLSRIKEYGLLGDRLIVKLRTLSDEIRPGDLLIVDQDEYLVLERSKEFTKEEVLQHKDDFVEFKVKKL